MRYIHLPPGSAPPNIQDIGPFKSVVIIDDIVEYKWQYEVSKWIAYSGCYYMMAWGNKCSSWDDSVDMANLAQFNYGDIPDDKLIMTTWHDKETLSHVFWFCGHCAHHDSGEETEIIIIDITKNSRMAQILDSYEAAQQVVADGAHVL